jgi:hypothetical protein
VTPIGPKPLPLAGASERLRRRPGRPRKAGSGHSKGTAAPGTRVNGGLEGGALASPASAPAVLPILPRLLDLRATALYLSVSGWTVRDIEAAGTLRRVRLPLAHGGELRKLLFDRQDLDRLIEAWKDAHA